MKWTDGGGLPGHYTGPGQHVSGTHGPSSTTAPLSSIISIFVDKEFENNNEVEEEEEEEEGKYEGERRERGKESSKEEQNSPNIKRSRTQIPGGKENYYEKINFYLSNIYIFSVITDLLAV